MKKDACWDLVCDFHKETSRQKVFFLMNLKKKQAAAGWVLGFENRCTLACLSKRSGKDKQGVSQRNLAPESVFFDELEEETGCCRLVFGF